MSEKYQDRLKGMYFPIYEKLNKVLNDNGPKAFAVEFAKLDEKAKKRPKVLSSVENIGLLSSLGIDIDLMRVVSYHILRAVRAWCIISEDAVINKIQGESYRSPNQKYVFKLIDKNEYLEQRKVFEESWSSNAFLYWLSNKCHENKKLYDYTQIICQVPSYITRQIQMSMYADAQEVLNAVAPLDLMEPNGKQVNPFVDTDSTKKFEGFHLFPLFLEVMQGILDVVWHKKENVSIEAILEKSYELEYRLHHLKKNEPGLALNPEFFVYLAVLSERKNIDILKYLSIYKFSACELDYFMDIILEEQLEISPMDISSFYSRLELNEISSGL